MCLPISYCCPHQRDTVKINQKVFTRINQEQGKSSTKVLVCDVNWLLTSTQNPADDSGSQNTLIFCSKWQYHINMQGLICYKMTVYWNCSFPPILITAYRGTSADLLWRPDYKHISLMLSYWALYQYWQITSCHRLSYTKNMIHHIRNPCNWCTSNNRSTSERRKNPKLHSTGKIKTFWVSSIHH